MAGGSDPNRRQPRVLLSVIGIAAAGVFYYDLREYMHYQQQVQNETVRVLTELTLRVENSEQRVGAKR